MKNVVINVKDTNMRTLLFLLFAVVCTTVYGQQLVYTPKNPNFGGNTFNYNWLLSSASAQNSFQNPNAENQEQSELEAFQENINRQLLGQISRQAFDAEFGEEGLKEGTFNIGELVLDIFETGEGLVINILDTNTGEQTQIVVPN